VARQSESQPDVGGPLDAEAAEALELGVGQLGGGGVVPLAHDEAGASASALTRSRVVRMSSRLVRPRAHPSRRQ
jgi:hypothetical protein